MEFPYRSQRMPVLADNVVATSQPLAAQAGLEMLRRGGNAADAAVATAIALAIVEPTSNGIGSDAFAIVHAPSEGPSLHGLNASGRSPRALTREMFGAQVPWTGWACVTVPGAVSGWVAMSERFGRLDFATLFEPAIRYARDGFLVSPITAVAWELSVQRFGQFEGFAQHFMPGGRAPRVGERFASAEQADTLERIAATRGEDFYRGRLAELMVADSARLGGCLALEDLGEHQADWVDPLAQPYGDVTVHELPPNGQGLAALLMLGILGNHDLGAHPVDSAGSLHLQIEAMKLSFADAYAAIADPDHMRVTPAELLEPGYLAERAKLLSTDQAADYGPGLPAERGTVYLTAADAEGMMVSFIQSNYAGFGSGIVVPGTGIALQNRGSGFVLDPGHPNEVAGGKRPFQTIIPGFLTRDSKAFQAFGLMGGPMQAQGHSQLVLRQRTYGQNPQSAIDAPRWQVMADGQVLVEDGFAPEVLDDLAARGHRIKASTPGMMGGAQVIERLPAGGYLAASDPRKDGQAVGY